MLRHTLKKMMIFFAAYLLALPIALANTPLLQVEIKPFFIDEAVPFIEANGEEYNPTIHYDMTYASTGIEWLDNTLLAETILPNEERKSATFAETFARARQYWENNFQEAIEEAIEEAENSAYEADLYIKNRIHYLGQRENIATFVRVYSFYAGGAAHGIDYQDYIVVDLDKKKRIELDDLILDKVEFKGILYDIYTREMEGDFLRSKREFFISNSFYFTPDGIVFTYRPYEIASYADGEIKLLVSWQWYNLHGIINPDYIYDEEDGIPSSIAG